MDYKYVGNITAWNQKENAISFSCMGKQVVKISILTENMFRVRFSADGVLPASEMIEQWKLVKSDDSSPNSIFNVVDKESAVWINTSEIRIKADKVPFRISVFDREDHLLTKESSSPGMGGGNGARLQMDISPDEHFFGMGEGLGAVNSDVGFETQEILGIPLHGTQLKEGVITLDQAGKKTFFCNGSNWAGFNMTPAVIPFFMSTKGYGIYLNNFRDSIFDLGNTSADFWSITQGGYPNHVPNTDSLDYYFIYGPSFKKILDGYTELTGKTPLVPKWSLGYFQICHFDQTQSQVLDIARDFRKNDFPCDMLCLEPGWMKTPYRMDGWSSERFPEPDAMITDLEKAGFKLALWQCGPHDWIFTSWDKLLREANEWGVDITEPSEVEKYVNYHKPYYDQGISFFKQDGCGQSEWQPDEPYYSGLTGREMHNIIPTLYSKIMYEGYKEYTGQRAMNFTPHAGPSGQRYPGIWPSGDAGGGFEMFIGAMNQGLSGHNYVSHDFTDRSPAGIHWSLLGPWCPGALSSIPQGDMCQFYLKLRYRLIPYIYSAHWNAYKTGTPYMRAMVLEYQDEPATYKLEHQCMLGDWFLLAAYTNDVYLPAGRWFDYWTGEEFESEGQWIENYSFPDTAGGPLFVKGGAIIPMGQVMAFVDKEPLDIVVLDIYPYETSAYTLYEDDGTTYDYETGGYATTNPSCDLG